MMEPCEVCNDYGGYPVINVRGATLYFIACPECGKTYDEAKEPKQKQPPTGTTTAKLGR